MNRRFFSVCTSCKADVRRPMLVGQLSCSGSEFLGLFGALRRFLGTRAAGTFETLRVLLELPVPALLLPRVGDDGGCTARLLFRLRRDLPLERALRLTNVLVAIPVARPGYRDPHGEGDFRECHAVGHRGRRRVRRSGLSMPVLLIRIR